MSAACKLCPFFECQRAGRSPDTIAKVLHMTWALSRCWLGDRTTGLCPAGTNVKLQVQLVNLGNTIVKPTALAVTDTSSLTCKQGLKSATDANVWSSGTSVTLPADVDPTEQIVCQGTFLFTQDVIDTEQEAQAFTPAVTTTCGAAKDNAALPSGGYTADTSITVAASASLVVNIVTSACTVPSIIAVGDTSE